MKIELNIGLDIQGHPNTEADRQRRADQAQRILAQFSPCSWRFATAYPGPSGAVQEHGIFFAFETNNLFSTVGIVFRLAERLGQDCIAVFLPDECFGTLAGPRAYKWGDFDIRHFIRHQPILIEVDPATHDGASFVVWKTGGEAALALHQAQLDRYQAQRNQIIRMTA